MKIYISGKMTGVKDFNFPLFNKVSDQLRSLGYDVENPAEKGIVDGWSWNDYLRYDIRQMMDCDAIVQLPGWEDSKGAQLEHYVAQQLGFTYLSFEWVQNSIERMVSEKY